MLAGYVINGPSTVILDDDRDPFVSWQHHLDRTNGVRGGVDCVAVIGTPVLAPCDGVVDRRPNDGSAGNSMRFVHDANPGWSTVFSHLSSYVGEDYQHFNQGDVIAYTGDTGGVVEHLHRHLLDPDGNRQNEWDFAYAFAGGSTSPFPTDQGSNKMILFNEGKNYHILHSGGIYTFISDTSEFPNAIAERIGDAIPTDAAFIAAMKAQYAAQNTGAKLPADLKVSAVLDAAALKPVTDALAALGLQIVALPGQIDQYSDGRKQG